MLRSVYIFFLFCLVDSIHGQSLVVDSTFESAKLKDFCEIFEDKSGQLTIDSILALSFEQNEKIDSVVSQVETGSAIWFRFTLNNKSGLQFFLYKDFAIYNQMELYWLENGQIQIDIISQDQSYTDRSFKSPIHAFKLNNDRNKEISYYLKVTTNNFFKPSIYLADKHAFYRYSSTRNIVIGVFIGVLIAMIFFNLLSFLNIRSREYLIYVCYAVCCLLAVMVEYGYATSLLWFGFSINTDYFTIGFTSMSLLMACLFFWDFLDWFRHPTYLKFNVVCIGLLVSPLLCTLSGFIHMGYILLNGNVIVLSLYMLYLLVLSLKKGNRSSRFLLAGWSVMIILTIIGVLANASVLPNHVFLNFSFLYGIILSVLFLSVALSDKINIFRDVIQESRYKAEEVLLKQKEDLEELVKYRTDRLNQVLIQQEDIIKKRTQNLLDSNEKLINKNKQLNVFSTITSHNLRSPITNLLSISSILSNLQDDFSDNTIWLEAVIDSSLKIKDISKMIRYSSEIENQPKVSMNNISIRHVIDEEINAKSHHSLLRVNGTDFEIKGNRKILSMLVELMLHKMAIHTENKTEYSNSFILDAQLKEFIGKCIFTKDNLDQITFEAAELNDQYEGTELELYVMNLLAQHQSIRLSQYFDEDQNMYIKLSFT